VALQQTIGAGYFRTDASERSYRRTGSVRQQSSVRGLDDPRGRLFWPTVFCDLFSRRVVGERASSSSVDNDLDFFIADAGYLPGIEAQKNTIAALFLQTRLVDSTKTEWADMQAHMGASGLFHYMGHGRLDGTGTTLDYNGRRSLHARDFVPELFKHSQLVVLAACSTGKDLGLLDTNGLVRGFLAAGVPAVVASHWNVDSETTSTLMIAFYQNLAQGRGVAQAMSGARAEVLKSRAHPYYWAGFSLFGRAG
jgi:CHAT domain-containing protein